MEFALSIQNEKIKNSDTYANFYLKPNVQTKTIYYSIIDKQIIKSFQSFLFQCI